jgi:hypothetical protein
MCVQYIPLPVINAIVWSYMKVLATLQHHDEVTCKYYGGHGFVFTFICKIYNYALIIQIIRREIIWLRVYNELDSMCKKKMGRDSRKNEKT